MNEILSTMHGLFVTSSGRAGRGHRLDRMTQSWDKDYKHLYL